MDLLEEKEQTDIKAIVQQAVNELNLHKKVRMTHIVTHAFGQTNKKHSELHKYLDRMLTDTNFMRRLKLNSTIKQNDQTAIEYYGKDYLGGDENMIFDQQFEDILTEVENKIDEYLGFVLMELSKGGEEISMSV